MAPLSFPAAFDGVSFKVTGAHDPLEPYLFKQGSPVFLAQPPYDQFYIEHVFASTHSSPMYRTPCWVNFEVCGLRSRKERSAVWQVLAGSNSLLVPPETLRLSYTHFAARSQSVLFFSAGSSERVEDGIAT